MITFTDAVAFNAFVPEATDNPLGVFLASTQMTAKLTKLLMCDSCGAAVFDSTESRRRHVSWHSRMTNDGK